MGIKKFTLLLMAIVFAVPSLFAQSELKIMFSSMAGLKPEPTADDQSIPQSATAGVYEGTVTMRKSTSFAFYSGTPDETDYVRYSAPYYTNITFTDQNLVWPVSDDPDEVAEAKLVVNSSNLMVNWSIIAFSEPKEKEAEVKVTVNLNDNTIRLEQLPIYNLPEAMYIWGSENGSSFKVMAVMDPTEADPNVFHTMFNVPEVPPFANNDDEFGGVDGDPNYGFKFYLSTDGQSVSGGQIYNAVFDTHIIEFADGIDSFTTQLLKGNGYTMFDLTPGYTNFTFNYSTKELVVAPAASDDIPESEKLYLYTCPKYWGEWEPGDNDPVLLYNAETGFFEGVTIDVEKNEAFRFYTKDEEGNINIIGTEMVSAINFTLGNPYVNPRVMTDEDSTSPWYFSKFYNPGDTQGTVSIAVSLEKHTLIVTQVDIEEIIPEVLYIWGNENGGADLKYVNMGALYPSDDDAYLFTGEFDVPDCPGPFVYDDPEYVPNEEDAPKFGFLFVLSPEPNSINKSDILRFGAMVNERTINMGDGETTATLQLVRNNGGSIIEQTPGKTVFTFNLQTLEFTATLLESSAVGQLEATDDTVVVYNLQGVKILDGARREAANRLPAGLYIINGKKVMIGK